MPSAPHDGSFRDFITSKDESAPSAYDVFTFEDPDGTLPEEVTLSLTQTKVLLVETESGAEIGSWAWANVTSFHSEKQSDDPTDMDLFVVEVCDVGEFTFECDEGDVVVRAFTSFQKQSAAALPADNDAGAAAPTQKELAQLKAAFAACSSTGMADFAPQSTISEAELPLLLEVLGKGGEQSRLNLSGRAITFQGLLDAIIALEKRDGHTSFQFMHQAKELLLENMSSLKEMFDVDSGCIQAEELVNVMDQVGHELTEEEEAEMLDILGVSGEDEITWHQFLEAAASGALDHLGFAEEFSVEDLQQYQEVAGEPSDWEPLICFTLEDPSGTLTDQIGLIACGAGVLVVDMEDGSEKQVLLRWPWERIASWAKELQSDDPEDMELIVLKVVEAGKEEEFVFECDDGTEVQELFDRKAPQSAGGAASATGEEFPHEYFSQAQLNELESFYRVCDQSGTGQLYVEDLDILMKVLGKEVDGSASAAAEDFAVAIELETEGIMRFNEFLQCAMAYEKNQRSADGYGDPGSLLRGARFDVVKIWEAWSFCERTEEGHLDEDGLNDLMMRLGTVLTDEQFDQMLQILDSEETGSTEWATLVDCIADGSLAELDVCPAFRCKGVETADAAWEKDGDAADEENVDESWGAADGEYGMDTEDEEPYDESEYEDAQHDSEYESEYDWPEGETDVESDATEAALEDEDEGQEAEATEASDAAPAVDGSKEKTQAEPGAMTAKEKRAALRAQMAAKKQAAGGSSGGAGLAIPMRRKATGQQKAKKLLKKKGQAKAKKEKAKAKKGKGKAKKADKKEKGGKKKASSKGSSKSKGSKDGGEGKEDGGKDQADSKANAEKGGGGDQAKDKDEEGAGDEEGGGDEAFKKEEGVRMNKYGEAIIAKKKVELTAEQLKELEEQQKAFIIDPKQKPLFPDPMTEKQVNKLLAYAMKVPEALLGFRILVFVNEAAGLTKSGVVNGAASTMFKGAKWKVLFEDGTEGNFHLDLKGTQKSKTKFRVLYKEPVKEEAARTALQDAAEEGDAEADPLREEVLGFDWRELLDSRPNQEQQDMGAVIRACPTDDKALLEWKVEILGYGLGKILELKAHTESQAQYTVKLDNVKKPVTMTFDLKGVGGEGKEQFFLVEKATEEQQQGFSDEDDF